MEREGLKNKDLIYDEDEIDLTEIIKVIIVHKKFIISFVASFTILAIVVSLLMHNVYKSSAVILPTEQQSPSGISGLSSIASIAGISTPNGENEAKILALLNSNELKVEVIKKYNLLPILLYKEWDKTKNEWKKPSEGIISKIIHLVKPQKKKPNLDRLRMAEAIKVFSKILNVNQDKKNGTITISVEYKDPIIAKNIVEDILRVLKEILVKNTVEEAEKKESILRKQLVKVSDPTIQQGIYSLIANQIRVISTAKASLNFAFQVIDPPRVPVFKCKPKRKLIVVVAFISSLMLSIFLVFFIEWWKEARKKLKEEPADEDNS